MYEEPRDFFFCFISESVLAKQYVRGEMSLRFGIVLRRYAPRVYLTRGVRLILVDISCVVAYVGSFVRNDSGGVTLYTHVGDACSIDRCTLQYRRVVSVTAELVKLG